MNFRSVNLLALIAIPFAAHAQVVFTNQSSPNGNQPLPMPAWSVVSTGGDVMATIEPFDFYGGPSFTNELYVGTSLSAMHDIGNNYQPGASYDLGTVSAGTEIIVAMLSQQGYTYYTGSNAVLNPDGYNHTDLYNTSGGTAVDFEDLIGSPSVGNSDWNYGDAKVFVSNSMATPEPLPFAALGMGLIGLVFRRRK